MNQPGRGRRAHLGGEVVLHPLARVLIGVEGGRSGVTNGHEHIDLDPVRGAFESERPG